MTLFRKRTLKVVVAVVVAVGCVAAVLAVGRWLFTGGPADETPPVPDAPYAVMLDPAVADGLRYRWLTRVCPAAADPAAVDDALRNDPDDRAALRARVRAYLVAPDGRLTRPDPRVIPVDGRVTAVAFSPDARRLATATADPRPVVRVWEVRSARQLAESPPLDEPTARVAFTPDGRRLAILDAAGGVWDWPIDGGAAVRRYDLGGEPGLTLSADGQRVVTTDPPGGRPGLAAVAGAAVLTRPELWPHQVTVRTLDPAAAVAVPWAAVSFPRPVTVAVLAGRRVLTAEAPGADLMVGDLLPGALWVSQLPSDGSGSSGPVLAVSPDGRVAYCSGYQSYVVAWEVDAGRPLPMWRGGGAGARAAVVTPAGELLLTAEGGGVGVARADTGELLEVFASVEPVGCLAVSADGRAVAGGGSAGRVAVWRLPLTPEQAVADADRLTGPDPTAHTLRGLCHLRAGRPDRALDEFAAAARLDPRPAAEVHRPLVFAELGEIDRALGELDQALERDPDNAEARFVRGLLRAEQADRDHPDRFAEAKRDLDRAFKLDPTLEGLVPAGL